MYPRVTLDGTHVVDEAVRVQAILKPFLVTSCGQTLNNDDLLSVWFNDEDCLAYVRDAYFLNR